MLENLNGNVIASIIFIALLFAMVGLAIYKARKNSKDFSVNKFLNDNYYNLVNAISDAIQILLIKVSDYPDKESYERDIIRVTLEKLDENCEAFGIDSALFKIVDKETLTNLLYTILKSESLSLFLNAVPANVIQENQKLYDNDVVIEACAEEESHNIYQFRYDEEHSNDNAVETVENGEEIPIHDEVLTTTDTEEVDTAEEDEDANSTDDGYEEYYPAT